MRLPFFRSKDAAPPAKKPTRAAATAVDEDARIPAARVQARRRLIGALVLLLAGVVGFPILFETTPRPLPTNTPILVPEGAPARVVAAPSAPAKPLPVLPADAGSESAVAAVQVAASDASRGLTPGATSPAAAALPASQLAQSKPIVSVPAPKPPPAINAASAAKPATSSPAKPAPEPAAAGAGRFVVQVGAYNDIERLKAARAKLEKLGFKSYTQDVDTPDGKRTRVRVGPFAQRVEAEKIATKLKAAGMQAAILSL